MSQCSGQKLILYEGFVPMNVDKALANCKFHWKLQGDDSGRRRAEHRSSSKFTQHIRTRLSSIVDSFDIRLMFFNLESFEKK